MQKPTSRRPGTRPVSYRGRQASRVGSEQRRRAILDAALRIIVRDGVRAVRHRAVASEAGVPLSATTYYFKDIQDLIADTFTLFAESAMSQVIDPVWIKIHEFVTRYDGVVPAAPEKREEFVVGLAALAADFVGQELTTHREHLLAEQAFMQAAVLDNRLRDQALLYRRQLLEGLVTFCMLMKTRTPDLDGSLIQETFLQLEYEQLLRADGGFDRVYAERVLAHRFRLVFGA